MKHLYRVREQNKPPKINTSTWRAEWPGKTAAVSGVETGSPPGKGELKATPDVRPRR
jgi:hypothetical protein